MSQRIPVADWAAQVPAEGVIGLLEYIERVIGQVRIDLSQINRSGASNGQVVTWVSSLNQYAARTPSGTGSSGTTIKSGDSPAVAVRKRPNGQPYEQYEDIWFRWQYNVRLYGAMGNGLNDDSAAVSQALSALTVNGGGNLYFPEGYYMGMQNVAAVTVPCSISGDGIGQSVLHFGTTGGLSFSAGTSAMAFEVRDVSIEAAENGIEADGGTLYVDGVAINAFDNGMLLTDCSGGYVEHAILGGNMAGGIVLGGTSSQNSLSDIFISDVSGPAITCGTGTFDNRVDNIAFTGIGGSQAVDNQGSNNYVNELYGLGGNADTRYDARKELVASVAWQPCTMQPGGASAQDVLVPGATVGDQVIVGPPYNMDWCLFSGYVRAQNTVRILVFNLGPSSLSLASGAWNVRVLN